MPSEQGGPALGLAITKSLDELHGGKIWATSQRSRGSSFFFTIPMGGGGIKQIAEKEAKSAKPGSPFRPTDPLSQKEAVAR